MKVTEHIKNANGKTLFSIEILPPLKGENIKSLFDNIDPLMEFKPPFIDVTYHREEYVYKKREGGYLELGLGGMAAGQEEDCRERRQHAPRERCAAPIGSRQETKDAACRHGGHSSTSALPPPLWVTPLTALLTPSSPAWL